MVKSRCGCASYPKKNNDHIPRKYGSIMFYHVISIFFLVSSHPCMSCLSNVDFHITSQKPNPKNLPRIWFYHLISIFLLISSYPCIYIYIFVYLFFIYFLLIHVDFHLSSTSAAPPAAPPGRSAASSAWPWCQCTLDSRAMALLAWPRCRGSKPRTCRDSDVSWLV